MILALKTMNVMFLRHILNRKTPMKHFEETVERYRVTVMIAMPYVMTNALTMFQDVYLLLVLLSV